jgi:hypothetical protein
MLEHVIGTPFKIGVRNSSDTCMPVTVCSARKRPEYFLFGKSTKHVQFWTVSCVFTS